MINANQAQVVRCQQKDIYYRNHLKSLITDSVKSFLGLKQWIHYLKEIEVSSDLLYFLITTVSGFQTLGEEYVNILLVNKNKSSLPSKYKRSLMVILQVLLPYVTKKLLHIINQKVEINSEISSDKKKKISMAISTLVHVVDFFQKLNLASFYLKGLYQDVSKRLLGIQYVQIRPVLSSQYTKAYQFLGNLMFWQMSLSLLKHLYNTYVISQSNVQSFFFNFMFPVNNERTTVQVSSQQTTLPTTLSATFHKCSLCCETLHQPTLTFCGHLFCWSCITDWCDEKLECPICRDQINPTRFICLRNYL